jgi:SAM-dependent methyltransferase
MALSVQRYMEPGRRYDVLDFGSGTSPRQTMTHRSILEDYDVAYTGVDVREGNNIDIPMPKPYKIPLKSKSFDVVLTGQVFEHVPFFWASLLEIARVMRPQAYLFMTVPSRGHVHTDQDCWRVYPDGLRAMAAWSRLNLVEAFTDFPPRYPAEQDPRPKRKHDYGSIDSDNYYWGDTVGVFRKPKKYPELRAAVLRAAVLTWANKIGGIGGVAEAKPQGRKNVLGVG